MEHTTRHNDSIPSGVALGLFSKIAAARKESLTSISHSNGPPRWHDPQSNSGGTHRFPDIHDSHTDLFQQDSALNGSKAPKLVVRPASRGSRRPKEPLKAATSRSRRESEESMLRPSVAQLARPPGDSIDQHRHSLIQSSSRGFHEMHATGHFDNGNRPATAGEMFGALDPRQVRNDSLMPDVKAHTRKLDGHFTSASQPISSSYRASLDLTKPRTSDGSRVHTSRPMHRPQTSDIPTASNGSLPLKPLTKDSEIFIAENPAYPGVPILSRNSKSKAANPERLNLDRRSLATVPVLEAESMLRLLNLQNNAIRRIENLSGLANLIFLDLYNNRIEKLENLHAVPNLRVLMLGRNRIRQIENLGVLRKLDVLDLHSNEIDEMKNLNDLKELRVLNLGGNAISVVENIEELQLLTELNLRRNKIVRVGTIGNLPSLQRLFLSNNQIESMDDIYNLFQVSTISELRLDSNRVCEVSPLDYRSRVIQNFPALKHLDLKSLSEDDRKAAMLYMSQTELELKEKNAWENNRRTQAIDAVKATWMRRQNVQSIMKPPRYTTEWNTTTHWGRSSILSNEASDEDEDEPEPRLREDAIVHRNLSGYSEVEVHGDLRVLVIYGDALEALESTKVHASVNVISFRYVHIDKIASAASSASASNLRLFVRLRRLEFVHNGLAAFDQLLWLSTSGNRVEELHIKSNAVGSKMLLRHFVGARLDHVSRLNGKEVSSKEREVGKKLFPKSSRPKTFGIALEQQSKVRERVGSGKCGPKKPPASASTSSMAEEIVTIAVDREKKSKVLDRSWSALLTSVVRETLRDMEQRDTCEAGCLAGL